MEEILAADDVGIDQVVARVGHRMAATAGGATLRRFVIHIHIHIHISMYVCSRFKIVCVCARAIDSRWVKSPTEAGGQRNCVLPTFSWRWRWIFVLCLCVCMFVSVWNCVVLRSPGRWR